MKTCKQTICYSNNHIVESNREPAVEKFELLDEINDNTGVLDLVSAGWKIYDWAVQYVYLSDDVGYNYTVDEKTSLRVYPKIYKVLIHVYFQ